MGKRSLNGKALMVEFIEFMDSNEEPPPGLKTKLFALVHRDLNPSLSRTIEKVFLFHVIGSFVTLLLCPPHGRALFNFSGLITDQLMGIHPAVCFFVCGLLWMLGGQWLTYKLLTFDEYRVLGRYRWGTAFTTILLSVLFLSCLSILSIDVWLLLWLLGASLTVIVFNAFALRSKRRIHNNMRPFFG